MIAIVSDAAIATLAPRIDIDRAVREAFVAVARGTVLSAPVLRVSTGAPGNALNLKFGASSGLIGGKIGSYWSGNRDRGLPNHDATTIIIDPETGFPACLIAARLLNRLRTAAGNAAATDALARRDAGVLALIGSGAQAPFEARAIAGVRKLDEIRVAAARNRASTGPLLDDLGGLAPRVVTMSIEDAVRGADIVVTATAARAPLFAADLVAPGTHVSAMGADAAGKQELDPDLLRRAAVFADDPDQAGVIGECQHAEARPRPIGAVLDGRAPGRVDDSGITVFDSSGLAIQDLFVARAALDAARAAGLVQEVAF